MGKADLYRMSNPHKGPTRVYLYTVEGPGGTRRRNLLARTVGAVLEEATRSLGKHERIVSVTTDGEVVWTWSKGYIRSRP
jgi:hypothetical protein